MKKLSHVLKNEDGIAMIGIIVLLTAGVLSYTAFTATSFVMMMGESKRQKREMIGFEAMQQIGQLLLVARQRHHNRAVSASVTNCTGEPGGNTRNVGNFCFPPVDTSALGGVCIDHPSEAGTDVCMKGAVAGATTPTLEISFRRPEPKTFFGKVEKAVKVANLWTGEKAFRIAKRLTDEAPVAHALTRRMFFPTLGAVNSYNWASGAVNCDATSGYDGAVDPEVLCMPCSEDGNAANTTGTAAASCIRLKLCLRNINGFGPCDPAISAHWFWQTIAVTAPVSLSPYP